MNVARSVLVALAWLAFTAVAARAEDAVAFEVHAVADHPGPHTRAYLGLEPDADGSAANTLLFEPPLLDGTALRFASLDYNTEGQPIVLITLTADGTKRFEQITHDRVGQQLGLVIGGQLYSMPRVMETIRGGKIAISGSFTPRQAASLVVRLNAALADRAAAH